MKHIKKLVDDLERKATRQRNALEATEAQLDQLKPMLNDPSQLDTENGSIEHGSKKGPASKK